ncbi:uncharacterized protein LOC124928235 [Impatiens glandulifera]|uniref:uncharacterized protein LOC124928235 n=1 Tax=Impatiens glandulifera TaxID=253017 RepID=UPI001FB0CD25|nr:uncharacterized protein LOC124928235 [Impatiens glandulifera]
MAVAKSLVGSLSLSVNIFVQIRENFLRQLPFYYLLSKRIIRRHISQSFLVSKKECFSLQQMEHNTKTSQPSKKQHDTKSSTSTNEVNVEMSNTSNSSFVNHGLMAWNQSRKVWVGDQPKESKRTVKDSVISWTSTYEDLLSTNSRFPESIPLAEMVDFLVDIWYDEILHG